MRRLITLLSLCFGILSAQNPLPPQELRVEETARSTGVSARISDGRDIEISATGNLPWIGLHLKPLDKTGWNLSAFRYLECEAVNHRKNGFCGVAFYMNDQFLGRTAIRPGETRKLRFKLNHQAPGRFDPGFPARLTGVPDGFRGGRNIDTANVTRFRIETFAPGKAHFSIRKLRASGHYAPPGEVLTPNDFFPCIDRYGQYIHQEWKEKIHTDSDFRKNLQMEEHALRSPVPAWNQFGGWEAGPQLKATGFFRTEKFRGKWYLVDPSGRLFFSRGINSIRYSNVLTGGTGAEKFFEGKSTRKNGKFGFTSENLKKKYGENYRERFGRFMMRRMADWGFNTLGNWSAHDICRMRQHPYVVNLPLPSGLPRLAKGGFYDVFDPAFEPGMQKIFSKEFDWCKNDPWCIGIFIGNELRFSNRKRSLGTDALTASPQTAAKKELFRDLQKKYTSIASLNRAWKTRFTDWKELMQLRELPAGNAWKKDIDDFFEKSVRRFFAVSKAVIKSNSPNTLYLGSRLFVGYDYRNERLNRAAGEYWDVVSYNLYQPHYDHFAPHGLPDVPVIITESSIGGCRARGGWGIHSDPGLMPDARKEAFLCQYESAARHPNIVGIHFFCLFDQPVLGRWDGENCDFGLLDITDSPYTDVVKANREFSERLYEFRQNTEPVFTFQQMNPRQPAGK